LWGPHLPKAFSFASPHFGGLQPRVYAQHGRENEQMSVQTKSLLVAAIIASAIAAPGQAQDLKQVGTIAIPGAPINQFGAITIDPSTGLGYLADKDNKAVVVFDTKTDKYVSRITGFVGVTKNGDASGPNGVLIANGMLWVSDGDSTVKVVDLKTGQIADTIATGGKVRANAMAYDPTGRSVLVANSNEETPFISLISTEPGHKILAKIPVAESAENIERSAYHGPSGMFYTAIPVLTRDKSKGILAQTDANSGKLIKLHELDGCHPHSLQIVSDATIFLGCSNGHGASPRPGGDLAIFDIASGKLDGRGADLGGNGGSELNPKLGLYYHATTSATLVVIDMKTRRLVQKITTSPGARSVGVSPVNDRVYLATTAKDGPCAGCIVVYGAQ
jgi:DNA-binding beta-propeller fold protein YncE